MVITVICLLMWLPCHGIKRSLSSWLQLKSSSYPYHPSKSDTAVHWRWLLETKICLLLLTIVYARGCSGGVPQGLIHTQGRHTVPIFCSARHSTDCRTYHKQCCLLCCNPQWCTTALMHCTQQPPPHALLLFSSKPFCMTLFCTTLLRFNLYALQGIEVIFICNN